MKNRKTLVSILILSVMFVTACMGGDTTTPSTDDITPQSQPISETAPDAVVPSEVDEYLSDVEVITYDDMNTFNQNLWNDPASLAQAVDGKIILKKVGEEYLYLERG